MGQLKRIKIEGFKSIRSAELELRPINVLIGANGSGKSNLVSFFSMLRHLLDEFLQLSIERAGGADSLLHFGQKRTTRLNARLEYSLDGFRDAYALELVPAPVNTLAISREHLVRYREDTLVREVTYSGGRESSLTRLPSQNELRQSLIECLGQTRAYHFHDTSGTAGVRQPGYIHNNSALLAEAENLAAMLYLYQETAAPQVLTRITAAVRQFAPSFHEFVLVPDRLNQNNIRLNWRGADPDYLFGPHQLSDGTLRAIALCTLFLQPEDDLPNVIVVDEPELGLHPQALSILAGMVQSVSYRTQVILATQSSELVSFFEPEDIVVVNANNDETTFERLSREELAGWLEQYSLGELWRKNVIAAGPLS